MHNPAEILENPGFVEELLRRRNQETMDISGLKKIITKNKDLKYKLDTLRAERNSSSKKIGGLLAEGKKEEAEALKADVRKVGDDIASLEKDQENLQTELEQTLYELPNKLQDDVPEGKDETQNILVRTHGKKPEFSFSPLPHYEIGEKMGIFDFNAGVKLAGSRFYTYRGLAAQLERALINFMIDLHTGKFGYKEVWVPYLVNEESMLTTGQYPKFKGEFYSLEKDGLALIPTAEVPLVNLYRDEIIPENELPIAITAQSSCFRREAGAAGRDTRGLIRVHQFQKVELVQLVHPDRSNEIHEEMLSHAEEVLKQLGLHYRVMLLCGGDTGAAASKTYDIEVWMPGMNRFLEISSISNCLDFQSRRGKIRYRPSEGKGKPALVHTLNGSGLAAGRTLIALMENYQTSDGEFTIPEVLKPYFRAPV